MRDDERDPMKTIDEALANMRTWWQDPSRKLPEYVSAPDVPSANAASRHANSALITELERLEAERSRLRSLSMGGQEVGADLVEALASRVERLRLDFSTLMP